VEVRPELHPHPAPSCVANETIGGDGKALMLHQESWMLGLGRLLLAWVFLRSSGSAACSTLVRTSRCGMLENQFIGYRIDHHNMLNQFVIRRIANYMGWPAIKAHMRRFKMADDLPACKPPVPGEPSPEDSWTKRSSMSSTKIHWWRTSGRPASPRSSLIISAR
jgi:hypothetical protein